MDTLLSPATLLVLASAGFVLYRSVYVLHHVLQVKKVPIQWCLIDPMTAYSALFPKTWWNPTLAHAWENKHSYEKQHCEVKSIVPLMIGTPRLYLASPEATREILNDVKMWTKPTIALGLNIMGSNVVSSVGEEWRRQRKITAPAFDGQIYIDVWNVTTRLYKQMTASEAWRSSDQHYFECFNNFTTRLALLVIASSGFNLNIDWEESVHRENLKEAVDESIVTVSGNLMPLIGLPRWAFKLPIEFLRKLDTAFAEMQKFLQTEVALKKEELARDKKLNEEITAANRNLFTRVVTASELEGPKGLSSDEIIGNLFIYLFAGHETTASTLVNTLALLAMNQNEQEKVYHHIRSVAGDRDMTYNDYNNLAPVLHCFYEALRLYPAASNLLRVNARGQDATLSAPGLTLGGPDLHVPKDTEIVLDFIAMSRNSRHFTEPDFFRPRRWAETSTAMDSFLGFSVGPRLCLGRKFATVESVAFLSNLLREWKFDIKLGQGETLEEWNRRIMVPTIGVTVKIDDVPLLVTRRKTAHA